MGESSEKFYLSKNFYISLAVIFFGGILFLFLLNSYIMPAYTNYGEGLTVPNVTRISLDDAKETLTSYDLRFEVAERRSNEAFPANYVIDQSPTPAEIVKPNRKVYLTVNVFANPTVNVPDVTNLSLRNARIQLQNAGLNVETISYESSRFKNTVLRQSVEVDKKVNKGSNIDLVVSDGLGEKLVAIPDIVGLRLTEAQQKLRQTGLRIGEVRFRPIRDTPPNVILEFSPKADTVTEGQSLQLVVSERFDAEEQDESGAVMDSTMQPDSSSVPQQKN
jgi:beta-lactam-binding protein with PASTA domain